MLEEMVLPSRIRQVLDAAARSGDVPNLLLYGPAGTGKTTAARALLREYFAAAANSGGVRGPLDLDVLTLNASDDRSLDMVRAQLRQYLRLGPCPGNPRGLRFVVLDEFDAMTRPAQAALKMLVREQRASEEMGSGGSSSSGGGGGVRFVLMCNYLSRVDPALRDEMVCLRFNALPPAAVDAFLARVAAAEGLPAAERTPAAMAALRARHGGSDLRAMLHALQAGDVDAAGGLGGSAERPSDAATAALRAALLSPVASALDGWTDRERRAAVALLHCDSDHPERTAAPSTRAAAALHLLGQTAAAAAAAHAPAQAQVPQVPQVQQARKKKRMTA